jgi:hypothetical protein
MPQEDAVPTDICADQGCVRVNQLAVDQSCVDTHLYCALENLFEAPYSPALSETGQAAVIWKRLMKSITGKPPDRQINLSFPNQSPIMNNSLAQPCQHQAQCCFRIHSGAVLAFVIAICNHASQRRLRTDLPASDLACQSSMLLTRQT